ncbi:MAG: molybdopterin-binding/glycosyltransferase family 2 protein [Alphaproteobacteria bacterium]|nr:molybdopterin-binding/glycosyltransferase family 2 protein [Alphaproteobacteria bacterium]
MIFDTTPVSDAEGAILAHSTRAGPTKLKKGRILSDQDIALLQGYGVESVIAARLEDDDVHEDAAAVRIAEALSGETSAPGYALTAPFTGRVNLIADHDGVAVIDTAALDALNLVDEAVTVATVPAMEVVRPRQMIATVKIIPFAAPEPALAECAAIARAAAPLIRVAPFRAKSVGFIQTNLPDTKPSILDKTTRVLSDRMTLLGLTLADERRCAHEPGALAATVRAMDAAHRPDILLIAGASAITDRRDVIPAAIEAAGGAVDHFGMPVDPGNLLLFGRLGPAPVIGMPGCARSPKLNGFDWVLQRLAADIPVTKRDIMLMGAGGLLKEIETRPQPRSGPSTPEPTGQSEPRAQALLLAAGRSTRMGAQNKLTLDIDGRPMVRRVAEVLRDSRIAGLTVVTGHDAEAVTAALIGIDAAIVHNPDFAEGMSTSLKTGVGALLQAGDDFDAVLICLGDMPYLTTDDVNGVIAGFNPLEGRAICIPCHQGKRGNPILFDRALLGLLSQAEGDMGARRLIAEHEEVVCETRAGPGVLTDIDTPDALRAARENSGR